MADPTRQLGAYIDGICRHIPEPARRAEVRREIGAHLSELVADLEAEGLVPAQAVAAACARFGEPGQIGPALAAARRRVTPAAVLRLALLWFGVSFLLQPLVPRLMDVHYLIHDLVAGTLMLPHWLQRVTPALYQLPGAGGRYPLFSEVIYPLAWAILLSLAAWGLAGAAWLAACRLAERQPGRGTWPGVGLGIGHVAAIAGLWTGVSAVVARIYPTLTAGSSFQGDLMRMTLMLPHWAEMGPGLRPLPWQPEIADLVALAWAFAIWLATWALYRGAWTVVSGLAAPEPARPAAPAAAGSLPGTSAGAGGRGGEGDQP